MTLILPPLAAPTRPLLITGSAGFIGSAFTIDWVQKQGGSAVSLDRLTYAGNRANLAALDNDPRHIFIQGDIGNRALTERMLATYRPSAIVNFAAETHVDRSLTTPDAFIETNVAATQRLLDSVRLYVSGLSDSDGAAFRFLHISTDEVFGSLASDQPPADETSPYRPNSPYAASKAAGDHLARAYGNSYGLPVLTTYAANNYGPRQFPEKLIPLMITQALAGQPLPLYGDGQHIRDWIYVEDHCAALRRVLEAGRVGETYAVGGGNQITNQDVVQSLCDILDRLRPLADGRSYRAQITHVADRPGHDRCYALDCAKIATELGWQPRENFASGLEKTVRWYLDHQAWVATVAGVAHRQWMQTHYAPVAVNQ